MNELYIYIHLNQVRVESLTCIKNLNKKKFDNN